MHNQTVVYFETRFFFLFALLTVICTCVWGVCLCVCVLDLPQEYKLFSISFVVTSCALSFPRVVQPGLMHTQRHTGRAVMCTVPSFSTGSLLHVCSFSFFFADIHFEIFQ